MEKKYLKNIIKNITYIKNYKEYNYIFKINIKDIEKL
jgi:hypothetical protein